MTHTPKAQHEAELDVFLARAGMVVPTDRRQGVVEGWADFRAQLSLVHMRRDATHEPSNIFRMKGAAR